ncbi:hypothetical protein [Flavobacterium chilense]|uniref:Lipoprotein n=1 Tax=Flavobacterium chilense TaxID=946677 RepID=A0A1M6ZP11_9FLAO|nr:hypothetical protein [Flavobacterium chilense]SHL32211.1 hypothetical protein SAMN05444484_1011104 [Flavobacterium chilense]
MRKTIILVFIISFSLFISCQNKNKEEKNISLKKETDDTKKLESEITNNTIYPVYDLANNTTAIVITMFESDSISQYQKIYTRINETDSLESAFYNPSSVKIRKIEYYDTLGIVKLIKSTRLENEIRKIIDPKYYVYGTKGFSVMTADEVICRIDDCRESFIGLTIKNFDTAKNGKPLFCTNKPLKLNYGKNYFEIQRKIQKFDDSVVYRYDDSIKTKVYANIGPAYFTYNDDFLWGKISGKSKCQFPERRILILQKDNTFKTILLGGLDLYGASCD